ncbi:hypothetical protein D3C74_91030 [compost metagenome]
MWVKVLAVILFGTIALAFLTDLYVIEQTYGKAGRAIEHSIDAGIIHSGIVEDAQEGVVRLEVAALRESVRDEFQDYMHLDDNLENRIMKDSQFDVSISYNDEVPIVNVLFSTSVSFSIPDIDYPITVKRNILYESVYK